MHGCCRRRLHSGTHIGRNHGPTAVTATVVRRHQNASLNPTRRAGSMRGRSLTLRAREELQKLARAATPHPDRSAFAFNAHQALHAALVCRRVQACNAAWVNVARFGPLN